MADDLSRESPSIPSHGSGGGASRNTNRGGGGGGGAGGGGGGAYPESVSRLIDEFAKLPGIGRRSAERLAFHVLKSTKHDAAALARAIDDVKRAVRHCSICYNLADADPCPVCASPSRDASTVLVVEQPKDLIAIEQTGMYRGVYHVLMGRLSPLEGVGPGHLTITELLSRIEHPEKNAHGEPVREVVLGLNPTLEGDGTALYLAQQLHLRGVRVTRLARGLPAGSTIEFASKSVLADALEGRQSVAEPGAAPPRRDRAGG